MLKLIKKVIL